MSWEWVLALAVIAAPLIAEALRQPLDGFMREKAPGDFIGLSQGKTHFRWYGPKEGAVVLCIHGLTTPSFVWERLASRLAKKGYRLLTYDLYGRGFSDNATGLQDRRFFLRQLNDLLDAEDVRGDLTVIGYSMGGTIATAFAVEQPERVRHLVLLAPAGMESVGGPLLKAAVQMPVLGTWAVLAFYPLTLWLGLNKSLEDPRAVPEVIALQKAELNRRGYFPAVLQSLRGILSEHFRADHETISQNGLPVTAIWGREDTIIPLEAADRLEAWNPSAYQTVLDGAGHELAYTHVDEVCAVLEKQLDPPSGRA